MGPLGTGQSTFDNECDPSWLPLGAQNTNLAAWYGDAVAYAPAAGGQVEAPRWAGMIGVAVGPVGRFLSRRRYATADSVGSPESFDGITRFSMSHLFCSAIPF